MFMLIILNESIILYFGFVKDFALPYPIIKISTMCNVAVLLYDLFPSEDEHSHDVQNEYLILLHLIASYCIFNTPYPNSVAATAL